MTPPPPSRPSAPSGGSEPHPAEVLFDVYAGPGLVFASVCTNLSDEAATARLNREHPTGISSHWSISDDEEFADGTPMPSPCSDGREGCRHVLFSC